MRHELIVPDLRDEPYENTSYGAVNVDSGQYELRERIRRATNATPLLAGGDIDAQWDMAESAGDETAGGSTSTPDQNVTDEWGEAIGICYGAAEPLRCGEKERDRDRHRWELNPASAEDYRERCGGANLARRHAFHHIDLT